MPEVITDMNNRLTGEGRRLFSRASADERQIVAWLLNLDQDWPFRGLDIAIMILTGEHREADHA